MNHGLGNWWRAESDLDITMQRLCYLQENPVEGLLSTIDGELLNRYENFYVQRAGRCGLNHR